MNNQPIDWRREDPEAKREASKYAHPIPSRRYLLDLLAAQERPLRGSELAALLGLEGEADESLHVRLRAMVRDGQLLRDRRGVYGLVSRMDLIRGRVSGHRDGFGFLIPEDGSDDLFLAPRQMRSLMHGDLVLARVAGIDHRGRREGALVEILERHHKQLVGRYMVENGIGFLRPDDRRIHHEVLIAKKARGGAKSGQMVIAEIRDYPDKRQPASAAIIQVLGDHMAPGMEIDVAIQTHELPVAWPEDALAEAEAFGTAIPDAGREGRVDLTGMPLVTIDGEDARDFDDAVFAQQTPNGWRVVVAIADVSAYVAPGSALDKEGLTRGNSVYFPERVIPMLPEALSNGLCSLNPHVDRFCVACEMLLTPDGEIRRSRFMRGVMRSAARLTYNEVYAMLWRDEASDKQRKGAYWASLQALKGAYEALAGQRRRRGAIDFETVETRIVFGADRKIERIVPVHRNDAHKLIEECMIAANVATARHLARQRMPLLYRVHGGPTADRLDNLRTFLGAIGLSLGGGDRPEASDYAMLLETITGRPDAELIQTVLLRSLKQAVYAPDNLGHFGLSLDAYAHFTSPIRRYPDLLVHRAIIHRLEGGSPAEFRYNHGHLQQIGESCSMTERRADEATRDAIAWLKCEYMLDKVGMEFDGLITAVTGFGLFIELSEIHVEGLVHVTALPGDYYHFDPAHHRLSGERTGRRFRLADPVRVRVVQVNLDERKIDFELAEPGAPATPDERAKRKTESRGKRRKAKGQPQAKAEAASKSESAPQPKSGRKRRRRRKPKGE